MALKVKAKAENKTENAVNYDIKVTRAHALDNGVVMFDMVVNGVTIYGCNYRVLSRKDGSGDFGKIGFPSRKGADGKYYNEVYFSISNEIVENIEKQLEAMI